MMSHLKEEEAEEDEVIRMNIEKSMRLPGVRRCISNNYAVIIQEIVE